MSMRRRAFTLLEVLLATAVFGLAAAALLAAYGPVQEALFRLDREQASMGERELVRAAAEVSPDRATLLAGGLTPLPSGRSCRWSAEITPTATEALFRITLSGESQDGASWKSEYLRFEPRWLNSEDEPPQWLRPATGAGESAAPPPPPAEEKPASPATSGNKKGGAGKGGKESGRPSAGNGREAPQKTGAASPRPQGARK